MHDIVRDELEEHLTGKASAEFYAHMNSCKTCRDEVAEMDDLAAVLRDLSPALGEAPVPSPGFYARVASTINEQQPTSPLSKLFSPGYLFFRRVAMASVLLLAGLGTLLISNESEVDGADATAIIAQYDSASSHAHAAEPDNLLVTLAAYHQ